MKFKSLLLVLPLLLTSCSSRNRVDDKDIVIGCSPTPHALILEAAKPAVESYGYKLTIKVINDYVTPNLMVHDGDLDANYFQHMPYLNDFNESNGTDIVSICKVHFEPMGIYSKKHTNLSKANPVIAIPNDVSNGNRARALVESLGISNPSYREVEAQAIPSILQDVDFGVINGNYALSSKITNLCLATESTESEFADTMANVIAVKSTSVAADYEWIHILINSLLTPIMREFINTTFGSAVKAVF